MLTLAIGVVMLAGVVFLFSARTRFLSAYFILIPTFIIAGALLSFVISGFMTREVEHRAQATIVKTSFFVCMAVGALLGAFLANIANRRLELPEEGRS